MMKICNKIIYIYIIFFLNSHLANPCFEIFKYFLKICQLLVAKGELSCSLNKWSYVIIIIIIIETRHI